MRILTWHVHGSYLWYLSHIGHQLYLPVRPGRPEGYGGRTPSFPWPDRVREVEADQVADLPFDCVLHQSAKNWMIDQFEILSDRQRRLPRLYLEHDPPRQSPTDTRHVVDDPAALVVQVTAFNDLMWDCGATPTTVIEHGVVVPDGVAYTGEREKGIVVVNGLAQRGRRLGADVVDRVRRQVPLDLVGMRSEECDGLGEVPPHRLAAFEAAYRFFFNPIRWTSLGLAVCEAMMLGMPIVALATTEMATVIRNGESGYAGTDVAVLVSAMQRLLADPSEAHRLGEGARRVATERFGIERFVQDWDAVLTRIAG